MKKRVAVTGIGMVTPLGNNAATTWQRLLNKESGIRKIRSFDASKFTTQIAAEVQGFELNEKLFDKKLIRYTLPFTQFALAAAKEALDDANIHPTEETAKRWGLVAGCGQITADFDFWMDFQEDFAESGEVDVSKLGDLNNLDTPPSEFGKMQANSGVGVIAKQNNILGYVMCVHTACASGGQALGLGLQAIRNGEADYVLAGGYDSMINPMGIAGFCLLGALSTHNEKPEEASRPFDLTRNGFVLGEGSAFLVLEDFEKAKARGARIYAEFAGEGNSLSSYRITDSHPSGDGAIQAIEGALKDAGVSIDQIDYINAHGTSTKMNDFSETNAIKAVFGERAKKIPVSSTKSQIGHLISAAGAVEAAFSVLAMHHSKLPMTANLKTPDPECDLDYISEGPRDVKVRAALSNSFGFGGSNSCVVFKNPEFD